MWQQSLKRTSPCEGCSENPMPNGMFGKLEQTLCMGMRCVRYQVWMKGEFANVIDEKINRPKGEFIWDRPDLLGKEEDSGRTNRHHKKPDSDYIQNDRGHRGFSTQDIRYADLLGFGIDGFDD